MPDPLTAVEIAAAVRSGAYSAREMVEQTLQRIAAADAALGAYQQVRTFAALREADAVDARPDRGQLPLAGVPVAVNDNIAVAGEPMRSGSTATDPAPAKRDHPVVGRLRAAGAVVVGSTALPELGVFGTTDSEFGITRNPWHLARTPGGSSGGAAAAVAAGTVPIAHGNDGLGSIRIPAACCGLVGVKPGAGVVPAEVGTNSWFGLAENGPLATTVADAALMLAVLADRPNLARPSAPGQLRLAVSTRVPMAAAPLDRHWKAAATESAHLLRSAGHTVVDADPPYGQLLAGKQLVRWVAATELDARAVRDRTALAARTRRHAALGRLALRARLPRENGRLRWCKRVERFFADIDMLITPALAQPPIAARMWSQRGWFTNVWTNSRYAPFAAPWNIAGWPAMTVPAGVGPDGMPLAVQLVGKPGAESQLIHVATQLEQLRPWPRLAPAYR